MKKIVAVLFILRGTVISAQNPIAIPDTLTGPEFEISIHTDSVQFLPGIKTYTNAFNEYAYLGPTLIFNKGEDVTLHVTDNIPDTTTVHWHGLHVPAMDDGGPHTIILPGETWSPEFTVMNNASTFWYHPHTHMKTGQQAMRGAAGLIIVRDAEEAALALPRRYGVDDFPIIVQSQEFDTSNQILWRGMHDSILLVNGTMDPMLEIPSQVVRMRLLNASQERNFNFGFTDNQSFYVIGNDGGLLSAPVAVTRIRLSPGERAEILIDLSGMIGQTIYLMSYTSELPMGVQGGETMPGMDDEMYSPINGVDFNILQLNVAEQTADPITSIPVSLVSITPWLESDAMETRNIIITSADEMSMDGPFYFNDQLFEMERIDYEIPIDNIEIWSISNQTMVAHPFHIHGVQFFVLDRDGISAMPWESGYKDEVMIAPSETVRFITKFEDFADTTMPYMYHCHILMHEDDGMMGQYLVVPRTTPIVNSDQSDALNLYPNPANGEITIDLQHEIPFAEIIIHNSIGTRVLSTQIKNASFIQLNMNELSPGLYFVFVYEEGAVKMGKLIVE